MPNPSIAILHYTAPPIVGGVENVIAQHLRLLREHGYPVTLVAGGGPPDSLCSDPEVVIIPELHSQHPRNLEIAQALARGETPRDFDGLTECIETQLAPLSHADIVLVHNAFNLHLNLPLTAALHHSLDRHVIGRLVAWCHDISRYMNPASGFEQRVGFPWDLLGVYRPEVKYVAVSQARRRALAQVLGCACERIQVIPNGVDPALLLGLDDSVGELIREFDLFDADLTLLMPVRITRAKNIEYALRVTMALKEAGVNVRLVVTGPPDPHAPDGLAYYETLLVMRAELGLLKEVIFAYEGTSRLPSPLLLSPPMVAGLYQMCDLVLMPSLREGFGLPILEAGLLGKPVFSTVVPALEEVGEESVYLIAPGDLPEQVAARMLAWTRSNRAYRLRQRVRQGLTWDTIFARDIEPLLLNLVDKVQA